MRLDKQLIPFYTLATISIITVLFISAHVVFLTPLKIKQMDKQINSEVQKIKDGGEPVSLKEFKLPAVPDNENAILLYKKAFELNVKIDMEQKKDCSEEEESLRNVINIDFKQSPSRSLEDINNIISLLNRYQECLKLCRQAALLSKYSFDIDYSQLYAVNKFNEVKYRGIYYKLSALLGGEAVIRTIYHQPKLAFESIHILIKMLRYLDEPPGDQNARLNTAFWDIVLNSTAEIINEADLDNQDIEQLSAELNSDIISSYIKKLQAERCFIINYPHCSEIGRLVSLLENGILKIATRQENKYGGTMTLNTVKPSLHERLYLKSMIALHSSQYGCLNWKEEKLYCIKYYSDLINLAKRPPFQTKELWPNKYRELFCFQVYPPLEKRIYMENYQLQTMQDMLRLALHLENYKIRSGKYPDSLAALVPEALKSLPKDPFSGNDFIYRKEGVGFIIYSVGQNFTDDNGVSDSKAQKDDIVIKRRIP